MSPLRYQVRKRESCFTARFPVNLTSEWWHSLSFLRGSLLCGTFPSFGEEAYSLGLCSIFGCYLKKKKRKETYAWPFKIYTVKWPTNKLQLTKVSCRLWHRHIILPPVFDIRKLSRCNKSRWQHFCIPKKCPHRSPLIDCWLLGFLWNRGGWP